MKKLINLTIFIAINLCFCNNSFAYSGSSSIEVIQNNNTDSKPQFKIAKAYWLPDYIPNDFSSIKYDEDKNIVPDKCNDFGGTGYHDAIPANNICDSTNPGFEMLCYNKCTCKSVYNKTSCSRGYRLANACVDGTSKKTLYKDCTQRACSEGGYRDSCGANDTSTPQTWGGKTCYTCRPATCADGGYGSSIPTNNICSTTTYKGKTCYHSCRKATCSDGGYNASIPTNNICSTTTYKGSTCYHACRKEIGRAHV